MSHILSTREDMQYLWGMTHGYWWYDSRVLMIWLTGTAYPHGYWRYDSRVMHTLTGTEDMTHGCWWYDSRVMHILTSTAYSFIYRVEHDFDVIKNFCLFIKISTHSIFLSSSSSSIWPEIAKLVKGWGAMPPPHSFRLAKNHVQIGLSLHMQFYK